MNRVSSLQLTVLFLSISQCLFAQDSLSLAFYKQYKESGLTVGYNYNFGDKVDGQRPEAYHFVELGFWKSSVSMGHHPVCATYYFANDFGLNTDNFTIGPKVGGFLSILILGLGAELCYYTDFVGGSLRLIPSMGILTPLFKLTINPHVIITNKDALPLNKGHLNLTIRVFKLKRTELR